MRTYYQPEMDGAAFHIFINRIVRHKQMAGPLFQVDRPSCGGQFQDYDSLVVVIIIVVSIMIIIVVIVIAIMIIVPMVVTTVAI